MIFLVSIGILRTWGRGAGGGDTSKAFHRILIDATLGIQKQNPWKLEKSDFSAPSSPSQWGGAKSEFYPSDTRKTTKSLPVSCLFCPYLTLKIGFWEGWFSLKILSGKIVYARPMGEERRWDQNRILYVEYLRCGLPWLSTPLEIHFSISKLFVGHSPKKVLHQTIMSNPFCGIFARGWVRYHLHHKST